MSIAAMTGVPDKAEESVRSGWSANMTPGGAGPDEPGQLGTHTDTRDTGRTQGRTRAHGFTDHTEEPHNR